jgi:hypothetical protein
MKQRLYSRRHDNARVLILSQRAWNREFYMPLVYEFEDVIASVDAVDILAPPFLYGEGPRALAYRASNALRAKYGFTTDPGLPTVSLDRDYDLFFCFLNFAYEVPALRRLEQLRQRCKRAVCMFVEVWSSHVDRYRRSLEILNALEFDHVLVAFSSVLPALRTVVKRPCSFLPHAVDTIRFAPAYPEAERVIDCYSMGRRSEVTHRALMDAASKGEFFYFFDSAARSKWLNCFDHRQLTASLLQRTRFLLASRPSLRTDQPIGSDEALPARLFEGAASGAVLMGEPPYGDDFDAHFNWPDAVIEAPFDSPDIRALLADLAAQPERMARLRQTNIAQCLQRHDWAYRWANILSLAGLNSLPALQARREQLRQLAQALTQGAVPALQ